MSEPSLPRKSPCPSCPYRRDVPSGVWVAEEYQKLPRYDGDTAYQSPAVFMCHQTNERVCSGWLGHRDPGDLLAVRLGTMTGSISPDCIDYSTTVPLFASGAEAAEHGMAEVHDPGPKAHAVMSKVLSRRQATTKET